MAVWKNFQLPREQRQEPRRVRGVVGRAYVSGICAEAPQAGCDGHRNQDRPDPTATRLRFRIAPATTEPCNDRRATVLYWHGPLWLRLKPRR